MNLESARHEAGQTGRRDTRRILLGFAIVLCVALIGVFVHVPTSTAATPNPTLTGEELFGVDVFQTLPGSTCNTDGSGTISFAASGAATGPYPGPFTENGTVTLGPRATDSPEPLNVITDFNSSFTIDTPEGPVTGTKTHADISSQTPFGVFDFMNQGECTRVFGFGTNYFIAGVCYTATLPTGVDSGFGVAAGAQDRLISPSNFFNENYQSTAGQPDAQCPGPSPGPIPSGSSTPPFVLITITTPPQGASYSLNQVVNASFTCNDPSVAQCTGAVDNGAAIDTSTAGSHDFLVTAVDLFGNVGTKSVSYTVLAGNASTTVSNGGTITTDPGNLGASAAVPLQTSITAPTNVSGTVSVTPQTTTTVSPAGFNLFGKEVVLAGPVATPTSPYQVSFTVDSTSLNGVAPADVQVFRNAVALTGCTSPTSAAPDPCIASRGFAPGGGGDALVTVRTSAFSTWSLGRLKYALAGPLQPVNARPTVNTAKAGSIIPVRFRLGGDKGMNVLAGNPASAVTTCGKRTDEVEETAESANPALVYNRVSATYTYRWKTLKTMKGCRDLVLQFRDGSQLRAVFTLR